MLPMITISHIAMTSSSFLMLAASFERYCMVAKLDRIKWLTTHRANIATVAFIFGFFTKITLAFEFNVSFEITTNKISHSVLFTVFREQDKRDLQGFRLP